MRVEIKSGLRAAAEKAARELEQGQGAGERHARKALADLLKEVELVLPAHEAAMKALPGSML